MRLETLVHVHYVNLNLKHLIKLLFNVVNKVIDILILMKYFLLQYSFMKETAKM